MWSTSKTNNTASVTAHTPTKKPHHHPKQNQVFEWLNAKKDNLPASPVNNNMAEQTQSHTPEKPVNLFSYEYNFNGRYYVKEVTGTFYELTNKNKNIHPSVIYVPKGVKGLNDYKRGGTKQKETRKNRRKSNRRR